MNNREFEKSPVICTDSPENQQSMVGNWNNLWMKIRFLLGVNVMGVTDDESDDDHSSKNKFKDWSRNKSGSWYRRYSDQHTAYVWLIGAFQTDVGGRGRVATDEERKAEMERSSSRDIQGGPAEVRPTYIFDGNIWMHR